MDIQTYGGQPGTGPIVQTSENAIWNGRETSQEFSTLDIVSTTVDAGNTPTSALRPGLVLGKVLSSGLLTQYDPTLTNGAQIAYAVLNAGLSMLDSAGSAANKQGHVLVKGILQGANLIGLDNMGRRALMASGRYIFDDALQGLLASGGLPLAEVSKAADYTVLATDVGTLFTAITGAVVFTLPALAAGLGPFEFLNLVDANMSVISAGSADDIVWDQDLGVDSLAFSTTAHKVGGRLQFCANAAGTKWLVRNFSPASCTVTAA